MKIAIFDTETTSLEKPFCYNIGYVIVDTEQWQEVLRREFVVEQIWHNLPLFSTAYYSEKRQIYVSAMRSGKVKLEKFGYITQQMIRDFLTLDVKIAFAYNSSFDEKVFNFNCDWFKCINPFDSIPIHDIRGFVHEFMVTPDYKQFCDIYGLYTESGNYSTTAENVFRYITQNTEFAESHTALDDSIIETKILEHCVKTFGANIEYPYETKRTIERQIKKELCVNNKGEKHYFTYEKIRINKDKTEIKLS